MNMLAPFSEPVGWLSTTNFTRALEPTLSWNQLHALTRQTGWPAFTSAGERCEKSRTERAQGCDSSLALRLSLESPHSVRRTPISAAHPEIRANRGDSARVRQRLWLGTPIR